MSRFPYKQVILSVFLFTLVSCVPSFEDIDDSFNVLDAGLDVAFETLRFIVNEPETVEALVNLFNQNNQSSGDLTPVTINSTAISLTDSSNSGINLIDFKVLSPVTKNILFGETIEIELNYEMLNQNRYFARAGLLNDKNVPLAMLPYNGKQAIELTGDVPQKLKFTLPYYGVVEFNATSLMVIASEGENGITASNISSDFEASVNSPNVNCIEENSYFKDAVLEEEVRKFITKKTNQEYNCESVGRLTYLELPASNISSLSGIEKLDRLTTLVVSDNSITDLSPLNSLPSLRVLNASRNKISILKPINSLQTIEFLELTGNYIETIENLEAGIWGNLVKLDISDNCLDPKGTQVQLLNSSLDENVIILGEQKADCS